MLITTLSAETASRIDAKLVQDPGAIEGHVDVEHHRAVGEQGEGRWPAWRVTVGLVGDALLAERDANCLVEGRGGIVASVEV